MKNKLKKPYIRIYYNNDEIPSYIRKQILDLNDKLTCKIASLYRDMNVGWSVNLHNLNNSFKDPNQFYVTAQVGCNENSKVVGFIEFYDDPGEDFTPKATTIQNIWVEPEYRKMGIGSKLVRTVTTDIRKHNQFFLSAAVNNYEAIKFWMNVGFDTPIHTTYHMNPSEGITEDEND